MSQRRSCKDSGPILFQTVSNHLPYLCTYGAAPIPPSLFLKWALADMIRLSMVPELSIVALDKG